ncbi:MAG: ABC transporter ATP-binding protein/permease [Prevotellaceae bacterium]|jgi:ATP-binding cassette subfamily B protein|nr:ABC transporter ATP-binding protein/permease [Prevotellaceae bacterium]
MDKKTKQPKTGLARLWEFAMMKKPLVFGSLILSAIASVVSFVPYIAIYRVVSELLNSLPDIAGADTALLIRYGWIAFFGAVGNILLYFTALMLSHLAAFGTLYQLKVNFMSHLARVPLGFHVLVGSGKLRKIADENIESIEGFIAHQLPDLVAAIVAPVVMFVILFAVDWRFGLATAAGIVVALAQYAMAFGNKSAKEMADEYQSALEEMNNASVEYIRGISVVKAFRQTAYSFRRLHETIKHYTSSIIPYTLGWETGYAVAVALINNVFIFVIPAAILIGMFAVDVSGYAAFAGKVVFYLIFTQAVSGILLKVMYANTVIMHISRGVEAMDKILAEPELPVVREPKTPRGPDVTFNDVSFSYRKEKDVEALSGVSFTARQGEITAIVGPSGGGKSTIAHLIPRFFDISGGSVTIGGVDIRDMDPHALMDSVSFVFQDVYLFKQSVMENIRIGNPAATDEQVIDAAASAQCREFVEKLPAGYNTVIGTKGVHLSGGEKQRVAIARAIVKNAPIVVLDEATAFSEPENEYLIQKAFERLMKNKTVIMIAHRLSTVRGANQIIVIDGGRVVQSGAHEELLKQGGRYGDMWRVYMETATWRMSKSAKFSKSEGVSYA